MTQQNQRAGPNGLPESYWVENPWPNPKAGSKFGEKTEFTTLAKKLSPEYDYGQKNWYMFKNNKWGGSQDNRPAGTIPIIPYTTWKQAIEGIGVERYMVGDWVTVEKIESDGIIGKFIRGDKFQITTVENSISAESGGYWLWASNKNRLWASCCKKITGIPVQDYSIGAIKDTKCYIRCTSEEQYLEVLRVLEKGDILWGSGNKPTHYNYWNSSKRETIMFENGHITNGTTGQEIPASEFLSANQQPVKEESGGWCVGDKLENSWLKKQPAYSKNGSNNGTFSMASGDREIEEVYNGYGYVSQTADMWLPPKQQTILSTDPIPVTELNAVVGMKVVRGKDWDPDDHRGENEVGVITEILAGTLAYVAWPNTSGSAPLYRIGSIGKYELSIASGEVSKQVQVNNNLNNQKPTKTTEDGKHNTSKCSRWNFLLSDSEEPIVSRSGTRTGTAGYCGGELPTVKRGYKRIGKGVKGGEETTY